VPCAATAVDDVRRYLVVVQAYVLVQTEVGKAAAVAEQISQLNGVVLAEDVTGPYDVIVRVEAASMDELGPLIMSKIQGVSGIDRTVTCTVVHA
jgi:DNA-binding Lrp family transcriptional regulator